MRSILTLRTLALPKTYLASANLSSNWTLEIATGSRIRALSTSLWTLTVTSKSKRLSLSLETISSHRRTSGSKSSLLPCLLSQVVCQTVLWCHRLSSQIWDLHHQTTIKTSMRRQSSNLTSNKLRCSSNSKLNSNSRFKVDHQVQESPQHFQVRAQDLRIRPILSQRQVINQLKHRFRQNLQHPQQLACHLSQVAACLIH